MSVMNEGRRYSRWLLLFAAGMVLALSLMVVMLVAGNQKRLQTVVERQAYINQTVSLSNYNVQQVRLLATAAAQTRDPQLEGILKSHGITYSTQ